MRVKKTVVRSKVTDLPLKMCNICGNMTVEYQILDNAPLCFVCVPHQEIKKIPNESNMIKGILKNENKTLY